MARKLSFLLFVLLLFSKSFSQPQDFFYTADADSSDSLTKKSIPDTLLVAPPRTFVQSDQFREEVFRSFSLTDEITSEDMDNSIVETVGDLLEMRSFIYVASVGPWGQPEIGTFGGDTRGVNIFIDGNLFQQQDLYFPQKGALDLNSIPLSNISRVEFLPAGLANLWGKGLGVMGVNIITKDFDGDQPYSKVMANRGPYGFHGTQVELGRGLTARGKFYFTSEFKKSDGYLINSDYDGFSVWGKTTFNLSRKMDLKLSAYQYKTKMGLPLFPDVSFQDVRKNVNNWGTISSLLLQEKENSILDLTFHYDKQNQEVKSRAYNFESKKIEEMFSLTCAQTLKLNNTHNMKLEGYGERKSLEGLKMKHTAYGGYFSITDMIQLNPKVKLILFSRTEKEERLKAGLSVSGGAAYEIREGVNLFSTIGRFVGYPTLFDRHWQPLSLSLKDSADYMEERNPRLGSQKSFVTDLGVSMRRDNYKITAYLFNSKLDDFIFWSNVDTTIYFGHYKPINGEARIWGSSLNLSFDFWDHVRSYLSYSFKQGKESSRKTRLPYSPEHSLFGYLEYENEFLKREIGLKLRLETNMFSERFMDEYEKDKEPGVAIVNGKITVRFLDFHFYYIVRNITDQASRLTDDYFMPQRTLWWGFYWEFFD